MQVSNLQKSSAPFRPFFGKSDKNSTTKLSGRRKFYSAPFVFCGPLATLPDNHNLWSVVGGVFCKPSSSVTCATIHGFRVNCMHSVCQMGDGMIRKMTRSHDAKHRAIIITIYGKQDAQGSFFSTLK
jgi:hypothetical protein